MDRQLLYGIALARSSVCKCALCYLTPCMMFTLNCATPFHRTAIFSSSSSTSSRSMLYVHCLNIHEPIGDCAKTRKKTLKWARNAWILCLFTLIFVFSLWYFFTFFRLFFWSAHPIFICTIFSCSIFQTTYIHILPNLSPFYPFILLGLFLCVLKTRKIILLHFLFASAGPVLQIGCMHHNVPINMYAAAAAAATQEKKSSQNVWNFFCSSAHVGYGLEFIFDFRFFVSCVCKRHIMYDRSVEDVCSLLRLSAFDMHIHFIATKMVYDECVRARWHTLFNTWTWNVRRNWTNVPITIQSDSVNVPCSVLSKCERTTQSRVKQHRTKLCSLATFPITKMNSGSADAGRFDLIDFNHSQKQTNNKNEKWKRNNTNKFTYTQQTQTCSKFVECKYKRTHSIPISLGAVPHSHTNIHTCAHRRQWEFHIWFNYAHAPWCGYPVLYCFFFFMYIVPVFGAYLSSIHYEPQIHTSSIWR